MLTDCPTCIHYETCEQSERWDLPACINYKMMPTKNPTNADRIRGMTDEELAEWASAITLDEFGDKKDWLGWLKQEAT